MADILDAAQSNTPAPPPAAAPAEPPPPPVGQPSEPPVASQEPAIPPPPPATNTDSLIIPPPENPPPEPTTTSSPPPAAEPPPEKPKKKSRLGVLIAGLLILAITIPILTVFVRQQIEIRSKAAGGICEKVPGQTYPCMSTVGYQIMTCSQRDESNCKGVTPCCVWNPSGGGVTPTQPPGNPCQYTCYPNEKECTDAGHTVVSGTCPMSKVCCKPPDTTPIPSPTCQYTCYPNEQECTIAGHTVVSGTCPMSKVCCKPPDTTPIPSPTGTFVKCCPKYDTPYSINTCTGASESGCNININYCFPWNTNTCPAPTTTVTPPTTSCPADFTPWGACNSTLYLGKGCVCTSSKTGKYECKVNTSGGPSYVWAPCGGAPTCPWALTNGKCCPVSPDACTTLGDKICVGDPFISICSVWDLSCPAGHQNYWKHLENVTSCENLTPTSPPPQNTPTPTPSQCINIIAYKNGNALSPAELAALHPGDLITLAFAPGGAATKVRFRVNNGTWHETTAKNANGQFTWDYALENVTSFTIEAQWFDGSIWH